MPRPYNLKTQTVFAEVAGEIAGCRLRRPLALIVLRDW
jgi:hypothetical protein